MTAGDVLKTANDNDQPDKLGNTEAAVFTPPPATPKSLGGQPITSPGTTLPQAPLMPKQDPPWANEQPHGDIQGFVHPAQAPQTLKMSQVDNMTETQELNQKIVAVTVELAQKDALIKEKDARIGVLTEQLSQKNADFKAAADILAEKDAAAAAKDDEVKNAKTEAAKCKEELANMLKAEDSKKFDAFVASLPAGFSNKAEDVTALRAMWDSDPKALANKAVELINAVKMPVTKSEGTTVMPQTGIANMAKKGLGVYNMITHKWEDKGQ